MAIALFSFNANANEIKENTVATKENTTTTTDKIENAVDLEDLIAPRPRLSIKVTWGRKSKGCRGFGICRVIITVEFQFFRATTNDRGNLVLEATGEGLEAVRSHFGSNTITVEEDYTLEADVARQLGLPADYTVRSGRYTLEADGNGNYITTM